jgi:hypothetical protein
MAFNTLVSLRATIIDWVARTDLTDEKIDLFIDAAELEIIHGVYDESGRVVIPGLRCRRMEVRNSAFAITGEYTDLPVGFLGFRSVKTNESPERTLDYVTPLVFNSTNLSMATFAESNAYTIEGNQLRLTTNAGPSNSLEIVYYQQPPNVVTTTTNWILEQYPLVYLYGALRHLGIYTGMDARLGLFQSAFMSSLAAIHAQEKATNYSGSSLQMQSVGVTRT